MQKRRKEKKGRRQKETELPAKRKGKQKKGRRKEGVEDRKRKREMRK